MEWAHRLYLTTPQTDIWGRFKSDLYRTLECKESCMSQPNPKRSIVRDGRKAVGGVSERTAKSPARNRLKLPQPEQTNLVKALSGGTTYDVISPHAPKLQGVETLPMSKRVIISRALRGWSQMDLAEHAGCSQTDVSRIETEKHVASKVALEKIRRTLGI